MAAAGAFQSSPVPKDGRYAADRAAWLWPRCFNPRPSRRTGATTLQGQFAQEAYVSILARPEGRALQAGAGQAQPAAVVSILARPEGRALQVRLWTPNSLMAFQSSPVPKDGRYAISNAQLVRQPEFQSSPVPKDGRYERQLAHAERDKVFQSSPVPKDGRYVMLTFAVTTTGAFQSSPVPKDGRYFRRMVAAPCLRGFNPRPSRRTGAT